MLISLQLSGRILGKGSQILRIQRLPGDGPMIIGGIKLELIECPGFSQPPKGIYKEVIRQISMEFQFEYQTSEHGGKEKITVKDEPPYFNPGPEGVFARCFKLSIQW